MLAMKGCREVNELELAYLDKIEVTLSFTEVDLGSSCKSVRLSSFDEVEMLSAWISQQKILLRLSSSEGQSH